MTAAKKPEKKVKDIEIEKHTTKVVRIQRTFHPIPMSSPVFPLSLLSSAIEFGFQKGLA